MDPSKKNVLGDEPLFPTIDELLAEFPADFEKELFELERPESPSQKLVAETRQKMVQVSNLEQYDQQQNQIQQKNKHSFQEDRLLEFLFPATLLICGVLVFSLGIVIYLIAPDFPLKQLTLSVLVMCGCGLLVLVSIIRWKQKQVKQRSREK